MKKPNILMPIYLFLIIPMVMTSCLFHPKTVHDEEDQECLLVTKGLTIDYYASSDTVDEGVDEMLNAITSDCREPECLILFVPLITISAGSLIVSGSIVVVGNTIHWIEEQGRCNDSATRRTLNGLINSTRELGGHVINTGNELIEWFRRQGSSKEPIENK